MLEMRQSKAAAELQALIRQRVGGQDGAGMRAVQLSAQSRGTEAVSPGREAQPVTGVPGLLEARAPSFSRPLGRWGEAGPRGEFT